MDRRDGQAARMGREIKEEVELPMEFPKLQIAPATKGKGGNSNKSAKTRTFTVRVG